MNTTPQPTEASQCVSRDTAMQAAIVRLGNVDKEIEAGYEIVRKYNKTVTIFGSARTPKNDKYYEAARSTAFELAHKKYAVVSGGGHGIMEAANRGAYEAKGDSIGFNIKLPFEQTLNPYTTESYEFAHFAPRKIVMTLYANAYVYFPGGFGTLDELSEILTLVQTGKITHAPVILFGSEYWNKFSDFVQGSMKSMELISENDDKLFTIVDSVDEVVRIVEENDTYCSHVSHASTSQ